MFCTQTEKHLSKWVEMPKNRQEAFNKIYRNARDIGNKNLENIVRELFPKAVFTSTYIFLRDIEEGGKGSMWIYRTGQRRGGWVDAGNAKSDRTSGDIIHLIAEKLFNGDTWEAVEYLTGVYK